MPEVSVSSRLTNGRLPDISSVSLNAQRARAGAWPMCRSTRSNEIVPTSGSGLRCVDADPDGPHTPAISQSE